MARVLVAGSGILGAASALELAKRGVHVTVIDPAPAGGATHISWAWLNANKKRPEAYQRLNAASLDAWRDKYEHLVRACGALLLDDPSPTSPDSNYPCQQLSTYEQLAAHEPHISNLLPHGTAGIAAHSPAASGVQPSAAQPAGQQYRYSTAHAYLQEAWVDPVQAVQVMLEQAQAHGAEVVRGEQVQEVVLQANNRASSQGGGSPSPQRVVGAVTTSGRSYTADAVVLAAGVGTPPLASPAGVYVPLTHKPASVCITHPMPPGTLRGMLYAHDAFAVQRPDGTFMLGGTESVDVHERDAAAARWLAVMRSLISPHLSIRSLHTTYLPWPQDGWPIVGSCAAPRLARSSSSSQAGNMDNAAADGRSTGCDGLYVCVTHSGLTLAPMLGQLLAEEVCADLKGGHDVANAAGLHESWLGPWRPGRDHGAAAAGADVAYSLWQKRS